MFHPKHQYQYNPQLKEIFEIQQQMMSYDVVLLVE
jgi:hypothetical protein